MKKGILITLGLLVLILIGVGVYRNMNQQDDKEVIKIGAILPLSGDFAEYGKNDKKGIDLAIEHFKELNPEIPIEIIYEDNKGTAKDAVSAMKKMALIKPVAIIDDAISSITLSILPQCDQNNIVLMSTGATNPKLSGKSPYFFRVWNSDLEEGLYTAKSLINDLNIYNVSILYLNSDYGQGLNSAFSKSYSDSGGNIISSVPYDVENKDFKNEINKIDLAKTDGIYLIGYANQTGIICKRLREMGYNGAIFSTVATEDKEFLKLAGSAAEGVIYPFAAQDTGGYYNLFRQKYIDKYHEQPTILTDVGFDATLIILNLIKSHVGKLDEQINGEELKKMLKNMPPFYGASGEIKFDENGDVHKKMVLKVIRNNQFVNFN